MLKRQHQLHVINDNGIPRVNVNPDNVVIHLDTKGGYHLFIAEKGFKTSLDSSIENPVDRFKALPETASKFKLHVHMKGFSKYELHPYSEGAVNLIRHDNERIIVNVESNQLKTGWSWTPDLSKVTA